MHTQGRIQSGVLGVRTLAAKVTIV
jgi:hypothetical protein